MVRKGRRWAACIPMFAVVAGAGCGGGAREASTLRVREDPPVLQPVDVGPAGNSPGDSYYFHADLRPAAGGPVIGEVFGTKTLVKPAANGGPEQRATTLYFAFNGRRDQIVVAGVPDYRADSPEFDPGVPVVRAVVGGTGKYLDAGGELRSTRNADGSYLQEFKLRK